MSTTNVPLRFIVGYKELFGETRTLLDVIALLEKYPLNLWLNYLSRIQQLLAEDKYQDSANQLEIVNGMFSMRSREAIKSWLQSNPDRNDKGDVVSTRQVSVLQELAFLHAAVPSSDETISTEVFSSDLTDALLITTNLVYLEEENTEEEVLAACFSYWSWTNYLEFWRAFLRSIKFFQFESNDRHSSCELIRKAFTAITGAELEDFICGGFHLAMIERHRPVEEIRKGWHSAPVPETCDNTEMRKCLGAFLSSRVGSVEQLRELIIECEKDMSPHEFNLIALSKFPIVKFENGSYYVINVTALSKSLFEAPRHILIGNALKNGKDLREIGGWFGDLFELYSYGLIDEICGDRIIKIPEARFPGLADALILYDRIVVVVEFKSEHYPVRQNARRLSVEQREEFYGKHGLRKSIGQIEKTIIKLRNGSLNQILKGHQPDWTSTLIIPLVVTDDQIPMMQLLWDKLFSKLNAKLLEHGGGQGRVANLRIVSLGELEEVLWYVGADHFGVILAKWAHEPVLHESSLRNFVFERKLPMNRSFRSERIQKSFGYWAERFGFDISPDQLTDKINDS